MKETVISWLILMGIIAVLRTAYLAFTHQSSPPTIQQRWSEQ